MATGFGLKNQSYDTDGSFDPQHTKSQWERFHYKVSTLNQESSAEIKYKLLYLGRHGQAYHNVARVYYGSAAWEVCDLSVFRSQPRVLTITVLLVYA